MPRLKNRVNFDACTKNKSIPTAEKNINSDIYTETESIFVTNTTAESFPSLHWNVIKFNPSPWNEVNFDPHYKNNYISMPPDTKTNLISIQVLHEVFFDHQTKPSPFRSMHWNQINSDPPKWNEVLRSIFRPPIQQPSQFLLNTKTMQFSAWVLCCVTHTGPYSCGVAAIRVTWIRVPTPIIPDLPVVQKYPKKLCKDVYHIVYLTHGVYIWLRIILVAGLCYVPSRLYVVFLGVIYQV